MGINNTSFRYQAGLLSKNSAETSYQAIAEVVGPGEASAIALALERSNSRLILGDIRARKYAKRLGLSITGTIGVIAEAEKSGTISSAMTLINKIQQTNFWLSNKVLAEVKRAFQRKRQ